MTLKPVYPFGNISSLEKHFKIFLRQVKNLLAKVAGIRRAQTNNDLPEFTCFP